MCYDQSDGSGACIVAIWLLTLGVKDVRILNKNYRDYNHDKKFETPSKLEIPQGLIEPTFTKRWESAFVEH